MTGYDLRLSVNRAGLAVASDWWAALDYPTVRDHAAKLLGYPNLITTRQTMYDIALRPWRIARFHEVRPIQDMVEIAGEWKRDPIDWCNRSMNAAIGFAAMEGAKSIDLYGADFAGQQDFDGNADKEAITNRRPDRWETERAIIATATELFASRGIVLRRMNGTA